MKIRKNEFSFEESLKYLDEFAQQMIDIKGLRVFRNIETDEMPVEQIVKVFCAAMNIKVIKKFSHAGYHMEFVYAGVVSQILGVLQSSNLLQHVDMQADGGILALLNAPMKKDVEDIINLAAQVRSINDVVLKKFRLPLGEQVISVGIDYGPISYFASSYTNLEGIFYGNAIVRAKILADAKEDSVNISEDIYMNLSEDMQKNLFVNKEMTGELKYYFSQLINIRMRKWVVENK
jgi:hypothetical protein